MIDDSVSDYSNDFGRALTGLTVQPMFVVEFGLFATTFKRVDGQTVIAPNALLASAKTVHNLRRSSSMYVTHRLLAID